VDSARISTLGARAEDIFYITDTRHHPITSIKKQQLIRQNILKHLNEIPGFSEKPTENRI
jgi:[protein-PII] uridylyltransferase